MLASLRCCAVRFLASIILFGSATLIAAAPGQKTAGAKSPAQRQEPQHPVQKGSKAKTAAHAATTDDDDDPDLPAIPGTQIDKQTYLNMRDEYIERIRGIDPANPPSPLLRMNAIRTLEQQEQKLHGNSASSSVSKRASSISASFPPSATTWTELGPAPIPNGQTNGTSVPVSGRVSAIAVHPSNPNIIYVGAAQGGVYRSLDGGASWTPLMDSALTLAIGAIAIDPINPSTVFVGTGEGNRSGDSFFGVGVYRIDNADTNPVLSGPFETRVAGTGGIVSNGHAFLGSSITKIVVDPANDNRIFVGNTRGASGLDGVGICCGGTNPPSAFVGLYFSDNALSASPVFSKVAGVPGSGQGAITDIVFEPGSSDNMLVGVVDFLTGRVNTGIYRTTNASVASISSSVSPTFTSTLPSLSGQSLNIKFAINKVGSTVTALASTSENSGTVYLSTDGGASWPATIGAATGFCAGQCFYDQVVTLKPDDANTFFLGGQAGSSSLQKTINGGNTFTQPNATLHADTHVIVYAPSDDTVMYEGSDGGIWRSSDGGQTWTSRNTAGFSATQFQSLALHPLDREFMIGGTQDNGTEFKKPDGSWLHVDGGDGGYTLIDQNATDTTNVTMYHTYFNATGQVGYVHHTGALPGSWFISGCFGNVPRNGMNCTDRVLFYAPMARGPGNPNPVYYGSDRLYRSADIGNTNVIVSQAPIMNFPGTNISVPISTIAISPQNDNVRIVGLENGRVFATTTGSATLTDITGPIPPVYIARAVIDPNDQNTAYVTLDNYGQQPGQHVWKTSDLNDPFPSWTASGFGIPDVPTNSIVIDPLNSNLVYAATDIGVYFSSDGGQSWNPYGTGLPRVACFDIAIQSFNRVLRVATHGRGIWEIATAPTSITPTVSVVSSRNPAPFSQSITFTATVNPPVSNRPTGSVTFMDGNTVLATVQLNNSGVASLNISSLAIGSHAITASYSGDNLFNPATSPAVTETIFDPHTSTALIVLEGTARPAGAPVTFLATVSATSILTPTGTVIFADGVNTLATINLNNGQATFVTNSLSIGSHNITATYSGDANFLASNSPALVETIFDPHTTTTLNALPSGAQTFGTSITLTATINATAPLTPGGTVTFMDGASTLAVISASGGTAAFTTASLSAGSHSITAIYSGDTNFLASASPALGETITGGSGNSADIGVSIAQSPSAPVIAIGGKLTFTITVTNHDATNSAHVKLSFITNSSPVEVDAIGVDPLATCSGTFALECDIPVLTANTNAVFNITLRPVFSDVRSLTASTIVGSDANDTNLANNTAVQTVKVRFKPFRQ